MFPEQLKKILHLSKLTGDRVIIYDGNNPDDSFVVMDINQYLDVINLTEKIKKPVEESSEVIMEKIQQKSDINVEKEDKEEVGADLTDEDLTDKINQEISMWKNQDKASALSEEDKIKKNWQIPPAVKNKAHNIE